jgi:hypothetical protein
MKKTPLSLVKERFESKDKLLAAVEKLATEDIWLDRVNSTKGLAKVANSKLLSLHDKLSDAKKRFGTRTKLIGSILELEERSKDAGYKTRLERYPLPRLLDMHAAAERRARRAKARAEKVAAPAARPAKKAAKAKRARPTAS